MIRSYITRNAVSSSVLLLAVLLTLSIVGAAVAQDILPGLRLTTDPANDLRPAWSPDGTRIAFFSNRSGNNEIWLMNADGSDQRQLTNDPADDRRPAWSPDGASIAFDSDRAGSRDIWIMDADGGNPSQLTSDPGHETFPAWSPDGTQIAYYSFADGVSNLWLIDAGGQNPRQVTTGLADEKKNQCTFACHVPAWSPDGTQIAYQAMNHTEVWVVGVNGSDQHSLMGGDAHSHFPWWTPDGRLLYLVERTNDRQEPVNDIWVVDADGENPSLLFADIPHGGPFEFKPDVATIAFHSPRAGNFDIYTTVLGQEALAPASTAAPAPATEAPAPQPTAVTASATVAASASETGGASGAALVGVAVAAIAVAGLLVAVYLARRNRSA